ncbi:MAG: tetratricopeptide repeat protein [Betaproteobacteria bacterium]|nr:tetratricopeptide repeat protein [Betaproteobacteria bacterium]
MVKFTRGLAYFGAERYADAIATHRKALKINPDFPGSHQFLAAIFRLTG